jgi:uncharacterized membrane protein
MEKHLQTNNQFKSVYQLAQDSLRGNWGPAILTSLLIGVVSAASGIVPLGSLIIYGPLYVGAAIWSLKFVRKEKYDYENVFDGFQRFADNLILGLLQALIILGLMLLLIVPGIIGALALSQSFFIMAEDSNIKPSDALRKSREMMDGHKAELFGIYLVFLLLGIVCLITLGIGFLFLIPYMRIVLTHFYFKVRGEDPNELKEIDHLIEE